MKHKDRKLLFKYIKFLEDRGINYYAVSSYLYGAYALISDFYTTAWRPTLVSAYYEMVNHVRRFGTYPEKGENK